MRSYVMATGSVFGLLVLVHLWRIAVEPNLLRDPWYYLITALALAFFLWAGSLLRRARL